MNSRRRDLLLYTFLRLAFFVVPFAVLMLVGWHWIVALIVATLAGVSLSVIFLHRLRSGASEQVHAWRTVDRTKDDLAEDDIIDGEREEGGAGPEARADR